MGMYTALRGTIVFKTEGIAEAFSSPDQWNEVYKLTESDLVKDFINYSRSDWIPNGVIYCVGNVVKFETELKNYDSTIEEFYKILPEIADKWILEEKYEELSYWTLVKKGCKATFVNGDNSIDSDWSCRLVDHVEYPTIDVFYENNL